MADDPNISVQSFLERILEERDKQTEARFRAIEAAANAAFAALVEAARIQEVAHRREHELSETALKDALTAHEKEHIAAAKALDEFKSTNNLRLASMNEFRDALADLGGQMARRDYTDALVAGVQERLENAVKDLTARIERTQISTEARQDRDAVVVAERHDVMTKSMKNLEIGLTSLRSQLITVVAALGIGLTVISIIISIVMRLIVV